MSAPANVLLVLTACGLLSAAASPAEEPGLDGRPALALRTSLKGALLLSRAPEGSPLFLERDDVTSFWRVRLEPEARLGRRVTAVLAYEHRLRVSSSSAAPVGLAILPPESRAPYRLRPLEWAVSPSSGHAWRHEIDRAYAALHLPGVELTLGRQAVGWGRGVLFGAVDLFAPFAPLEVDREWRRGVDAVRADLKVSSRASVDVVGAFGRGSDASAFAGRLRGYAGKVDLELVAGRRGRDRFAGLTSSAAVGDAEIHAELAFFRAPEAFAATPGRRTTAKAVVGGSYRIPLGTGLLLHAEYHYSGFGAPDARAILTSLADPGFRARYLRGDTQILGRHAVGLLASFEVSPELSLAGQWLQSPADGSGLLAPSATVTFGDKVSLLAAVYLPYGRSPSGGALRSEYGGGARSAFVQIRIYD